MATTQAMATEKMMVATGHGLCVYCVHLGGVCGETTKNKEESKIVNDSSSFKEAPT
jgi:hypothetical protein